MKHLIIETQTGKETLHLQGKTQVQAVKGARYRVLEKKGEQEVLADEVIATREGQNLKLQYADGSELTLEGYHAEGAGAQISLPGEGGGYTVTSGSTGASLPDSAGESAQLHYAHGHGDSLMQMAQHRPGLSEALSHHAKAGQHELMAWVSEGEGLSALHLGQLGLGLGGVAALAGGGGAAAAATGFTLSDSAAPTVSLNGGVDYTTHNVLDGLFNYDINGSQNTTVTNYDGNYGTTDTYRYGTLNGVRVALPTANGGQAYPQGIGNYQNGTAYTDAGATSNGTTSSYDDLLAVWDAYNGTGTGTNINGTPSGWQAAYYWSATPSSYGHANVDLDDGGVYDSNDPSSTYVVLQVL